MPLETSINQESFNQGLEKLLSDYQTNKYVLPPLKDDVSQFERWFKLFSKWLADLMNRHMDTSHIDLSWLKDIWFYIVVALLVVLVALLIWQIYKRLSDSKVIGPRKFATTSNLTSLESIGGEIAHALSLGEFGLAARLRWLSFLYGSHRPLSLTPFEFLPNDTEILDHAYPLMFAGIKSQNAFESFDHKLKTLTETSP